MQIEVNVENLISLISNLLIRLRKVDNISSDSLREDIVKFVEYLEKYSEKSEEVLFDNNFITSSEEKIKLVDALTISTSEIDDFKKLIKELKDSHNLQSLELTKEHLRKIVGSLISLKDKLAI